jgi:uncharacterized protein
MISYGDIVEIITDSSRILAEHPVLRRLEKDLLVNLLERKPIKIITGLRRSGKSFILKRIYQALARQIPRKNLFFINFEDDRLSTMLDTENLRFMYETFRTQSDPNHRLYLFLDEIQQVPGWERFVRTIYDSRNDEIYITGSNSSLLSSEFSTAIGGRVLEYHLFPFSFPEYLLWHGKDIRDLFDLHTQREDLNRLLHLYFISGGLCETFNLSEEQRDSYRQSLVDKILLKDVIGRYRIEKPDKIGALYTYVSRNLGSLFSFSSLAQIIQIDDKTVGAYLDYLCNTFALQRIDKFEWKTKKVYQTQKKLYAGDQLFTHFSQDTRRLENLVFTHLCRRHGAEHVFFHRDERGHEVDFIVSREEGYDCYQVSWLLTDENAGREFRSLQHLYKSGSSQHNENNRFRLLFLQDARNDKLTPEGVEILNLLEFLLQED